MTKRIFAILTLLAGTALGVVLGSPGYTQTAAMPHGDADAGAQSFRRLCTSCHIATAEGPRRLGPTLFGVVGRHSGSVSLDQIRPGRTIRERQRV